jgi:hypothetical protein
MKKKTQTYYDTKKKRPVIVFKFSVLIWITGLVFVACFGAYMLNVNAHPEKYFAEWAGADKTAKGTESGNQGANVINPVPATKTPANEKYLNDCVFIGVMQFADFKNIMKPTEINLLNNPKNVYVRELSEDKIKEIKKSKPKNIYIIGDIPVMGDNTETDRKNRELLALADNLGVHYLDVNTAFKDNNGAISVEYINIDGGLNELGVSKYKEYILNHTVS